MKTKKIRFMDYKEYTKRALATAIYNEKYSNIYPVLGTVGEIGEVSEKIIEYARIDDDDPIRLREGEYELLLELGDVLWYLNASMRDLGFGGLGYVLDESTLTDIESLKKTAISDCDNYNSTLKSKLKEVGLRVTSIASKNSERTKKILRDKDGVYDDSVKEIIKENNLRILVYILIILDYLNMSISECMALNINKLESRMKRNKIKGDGDHR